VKSLGLSVCLALVLPSISSVAEAGRGTADSTKEHIDPTRSFTFRAPSHWEVSSPSPNVLEAEGDAMVVRFLFHQGEQGFDSLHVSCMQNRLVDSLETDPHVDYEYDFLQAEAGPMRLLDSAFKTRYDEPVRGHKEWRQRNLTLVSPVGSLCVIAFCPAKLWKDKNKTVLNGVVSSVSTR